MSQCTDVDKALADLKKMIADQNKEIARLRALQQQCCNSKSGNGSVSKDLEARVKRLESYCNSLENALSKMSDEFKQIFESIDGFMDFVTGIFK